MLTIFHFYRSESSSSSTDTESDSDSDSSSDSSQAKKKHRKHKKKVKKVKKRRRRSDSDSSTDWVFFLNLLSRTNFRLLYYCKREESLDEVMCEINSEHWNRRILTRQRKNEFITTVSLIYASKRVRRMEVPVWSSLDKENRKWNHRCTVSECPRY